MSSEKQAHAIVKGFHELYGTANDHGTGTVISPGYPGKYALQAADFPHLAGAGDVKMLANNQAFFFVANNSPKEPEKADITLNTTHLEKLLRNIAENGTRFTLMVDQDVVKTPQAFENKYWSMRGETHTDPKKQEEIRRGLVRKESEIISAFVRSEGEFKGKGLNEFAASVFATVAKERADKGIQPTHQQKLASFEFVGVETDKRLTHAVWDVHAIPQNGGSNDRLQACQAYPDDTHNVDRSWHLSTAKLLNEHSNQSANTIKEALKTMHTLKTIVLTPPTHGIS